MQFIEVTTESGRALVAVERIKNVWEIGSSCTILMDGDSEAIELEEGYEQVCDLIRTCLSGNASIARLFPEMPSAPSWPED